MRFWFRIFQTILVLPLAFPCVLVGQAPPLGVDIIRGSIKGSDGKPIERAQIEVRIVQGKLTRSTRTDWRGVYTVVFPGGAGDYLVSVRAVGMQPVTSRVTRRSGEEPALIADFTLHAVRAAQLDTLRTAGRKRPRPPRDHPDIAGVIGTFRDLAGETSPLSGMYEQDSDNLPNPIDYSVFGVSPTENALTINGARVDVLVPEVSNTMQTASTADATQGGFSGGQYAVWMRPGWGYSYQTLRVQYAPATWQWVDPVSRGLGRRSTTGALHWSYGSSPFGPERFSQYTHISAEQRTIPLRVFPAGNGVALERMGIALDSASRLMSVLYGLGVPTHVDALPAANTERRIAWISRFDFGRNAAMGISILANAGIASQTGAFTSSTALPSVGGTSKQTSGLVQFNLMRYWGNGFLGDISSTFSANRRAVTPYSTIPSGRVQIVSDMTAGDTAVASVIFGGNAALANKSGSTTWQLRSGIRWFSYDSRHNYRLEVTLRSDWNTVELGHSSGTFSYQSLEDLELGRPSRYFQEIFQTRSRSAGRSMEVALGDFWQIRPNLNVQYGVRGELERFGYRPQYNALIDSIFHIRTDDVPHAFAFSPRVGLVWHYGVQQGPIKDRLPYGTLSVSAGRFRSPLNSALVASVAAATGLPDGRKILDCVGDAVPAPSWDTYDMNSSTVPDQCGDGSGPTDVMVARPDVQVIDAAFRASSHWRVAAVWRSDRWTSFIVRGAYSLGINQRSVLDLNLRRSPIFTLASEADRPVFVPVSAPAPETGSIALADSRNDERYGRVLTNVSDLKERSFFLAIQKPRVRLGSVVSLSPTYAYQNHQAQSRDGTQGDPFLSSWAPGVYAARHTVGSRVTLFPRIPSFPISFVFLARSGVYYTPRVLGDINGDGMGNDNAFIFDPSTAADPEMSAAMTDVLSRAPQAARRCLQQQLGRIAARNSCVGPWTAALHMDISVPLRNIGFIQRHFESTARPRLTFSVSNVLGALDRLWHGSGNLRGWGEPSMPDNILLIVEGFDPSARAFRYRVNPRFGQRNAYANALRTPTTMRASLTIPLGPSRATQDARQLARELKQAQRDRATLQNQLRIYNPFSSLLVMADTLDISPGQRMDIERLEDQWMTVTDTVRASFAEFIQSLPETFDVTPVARRAEEFRRGVIRVTHEYGRQVRAVLERDQWVKVDRVLRIWLVGEDDVTPDAERIDIL